MSARGVLCTICARGGSRGVVNKNLAIIKGKPLIAHTVTQAVKSGLYEKVVISTDSKEIGRVAENHGGEYFFERPPELATDTSPKIPVIRNALRMSEQHFGRRFDTIVDLDATSPLRNEMDLRNSLEAFRKNDYDTLITAAVARRSPYFNLGEIDGTGKVVLSKSGGITVVRRQDVPEAYDMNASIYIWKRETLIESDSLFGERTGLYVMPPERSLDIDSELDLRIVRFLMESDVSSGNECA